MKKGIVIGAVAFGAVVVGGTIAAQRARATTADVSRGPVHESVVASGVVVARDGVADVRARAEGRVMRVLVKEGERVEAGQLLAEIDGAELKAVLARLEAERRAFHANASAVEKGTRAQERAATDADVRAAQQALSVAEDRARRVASLHASGSESDSAEFEATAAVEIARAHLAQAKARRDLAYAGNRAEDVAAARDRVNAADAALDEARERLDRTKLVAPIAGVVLARRIDEGDTVSPSPAAPPLFEIADATHTEVEVEVEELDALRVAEGLAATITTPGGRIALGKGTVVRVGARLQKRTIGADDARVRAEERVRSAWVDWSPSSTPAPIGARVEAVIQLPAHEVAARVPREAVIVRDGHALLQVPWGPITTTRTVTLGAADERYVEVRGIDPGTRVILAAR